MFIQSGGKYFRVSVWLLQGNRLKIRGSHLIGKVANKYLSVCERMGVVERNKTWFSLLPCCSVNLQCLCKKKLVEKKKKKKEYTCLPSFFAIFFL